MKFEWEELEDLEDNKFLRCWITGRKISISAVRFDFCLNQRKNHLKSITVHPVLSLVHRRRLIDSTGSVFSDPLYYERLPPDTTMLEHEQRIQALWERWHANTKPKRRC